MAARDVDILLARIDVAISKRRTLIRLMFCMSKRL